MFAFILFASLSFGLGRFTSGKKTTDSVLGGVVYFSILFTAVIVSQMTYSVIVEMAQQISSAEI